MTEGQQRGLDQGWSKFGLELADGLRDFDQVFGRSAPRTFEIGFGMGHATLEMAAAAPEQDFIGVEVHKPGVGALLNGMLTQNLSNIRVYSCDALEVLRDCVADASLDRVLLFFPDPWHKARHHKRRIVQASFAGRRIVVFSGGAAKGEDAVYQDARDIRDGGGNGSIIGRNTFQRKREDALAMLDKLVRIYKNEE